jgi:hypothetical protein
MNERTVHPFVADQHRVTTLSTMPTTMVPHTARMIAEE